MHFDEFHFVFAFIIFYFSFHCDPFCSILRKLPCRIANRWKINKEKESKRFLRFLLRSLCSILKLATWNLSYSWYLFHFHSDYHSLFCSSSCQSSGPFASPCKHARMNALKHWKGCCWRSTNRRDLFQIKTGTLIIKASK